MKEIYITFLGHLVAIIKCKSLSLTVLQFEYTSLNVKGSRKTSASRTL